MPFIPDNPEVKTAFVPQEHIINVYQIHDVIMSFMPDNLQETSMCVKFSKGFRTDNGQYYVSEEKQVILRGDALTEKMIQPCYPGATHYSDFKAALWEILLEQGHIPSGSIT